MRAIDVDANIIEVKLRPCRNPDTAIFSPKIPRRHRQRMERERSIVERW
jgi:hypothetical protein